MSSDVLCINGIDVVKLVNQLVNNSFELVRRVGKVCRHQWIVSKGLQPLSGDGRGEIFQPNDC